MIETYQEQSFLIARILYQYSLRPGRTQIKNYYSHIHEAFFKLKEKHPELFNRLFFDVNGHIPYSKELDSIIQDLQISGVISKLNPGFNTLIINTNETKTLIDNHQDEVPAGIQEEEFNCMVDELVL